MLKLCYKKFNLIKTEEYYFWYQKHKISPFQIISISEVENKLKLKWFKEHVFHTWITDLSYNLDDIFWKFSKTTRNEIKRSNKEGIKYKIIENPDDDILRQYHKFYNKFLKSKNLPTVRYWNIKKYNWIIYITYALKDWEIICYHVYINDYSLKKVRLLRSCSLFRNLNKSMNEWIKLIKI